MLSFFPAEAVTHHSNREVVVNDLEGHRVSCLLGVVWYHLDAPAVHENQLASFDLLQDLSQVWPIVAFRRITEEAEEVNPWLQSRCKYLSDGVELTCWWFYLLPSEDSEPGHSRCPEAGQLLEDAPAGFLCLKSQIHYLALGMVILITSRKPTKGATVPIASSSHPTVPSPPHTKILYSRRLRKKCSLRNKDNINVEKVKCVQSVGEISEISVALLCCLWVLFVIATFFSESHPSVTFVSDL